MRPQACALSDYNANTFNQYFLFDLELVGILSHYFVFRELMPGPLTPREIIRAVIPNIDWRLGNLRPLRRLID